MYTTSVIRQKGESQNGCFKKTKHAKLQSSFIEITLGQGRVRIRGQQMFVFRKIWRALFS